MMDQEAALSLATLKELIAKSQTCDPDIQPISSSNRLLTS